MISTTSVLTVLGFLSYLPFASAAFVAPHGFQPDGISVADIVTLCFIMLSFSVFAFYCIQIRKQNPAHCLPFTALGLACVCTVIRSGLWMGYIIEANTFPDNFALEDGLWAAVHFFELPSYILLYTALALVVYDRHRATVGAELPSKSKTVFKWLWGLLGMLIVLALVTALLMAVSANTFNSSDTVNDLGFTEFILQITFLTAWGIVTCYQVGVTLYVHKQALRANRHDRILQIMAKFIVPLGLCTMILTIAFTIIPFELASDICIDVPFAVMVSVLIHFGRKPGLWAAAEDSVEPMKKPRRTGEYIEMIDPLSKKLKDYSVV